MTALARFELVGSRYLTEPLKKGYVLDAIVYDRKNIHTPPIKRFPIRIAVGKVPNEMTLLGAREHARVIGRSEGSHPVIAIRSLSKKLYPHLVSAKR